MKLKCFFVTLYTFMAWEDKNQDQTNYVRISTVNIIELLLTRNLDENVYL